MEERNLVDKILVPNAEEQDKTREFLKQFGYYFLIAILSLISLILIPFVSGGINGGDFALNFPKTAQGWFIYWLLKGSTTVLNLVIFGLFRSQAKINSLKHPKYIQATMILNKNYAQAVGKPRSPKRMLAVTWTSKSIKVIVTTMISSIVVSALALNFDVMSFLSVITSVLSTLVMSYVAMRKDEMYWTEEYYQYALTFLPESERTAILEKEEQEIKELLAKREKEL